MSSHLSGEEFGAAEGTRTPDPIITNDVLYQLSYSGALLASGPPRVRLPDLRALSIPLGRCVALILFLRIAFRLSRRGGRIDDFIGGVDIDDRCWF